MKYRNLLSFILVAIFATTFTTAQTAEDKTWVSLNVGHFEYNGDHANEMLGFNIPKDMTYGFGVHRYLDKNFNLQFTSNYGVLDNEYNPKFEKNFISNKLQLQYKFANGSILKEDAAIQPYINAGLEVTPFFGGDKAIYNRTIIALPFGIGVDIPLNESAAFVYQTNYSRTFADGLDGNNNYNKQNHDDFLTHTIGIKFKIGGTKDTDGDGVNDKVDSCINQPGTEATNGCPDDDGDGIINSQDLCPFVPGLAEHRGCADTDGDKIPDFEDECPKIPGLGEFKGCTDTDGDSIADNIDSCPTLAGSATTNGCPDTDGDGIKNSLDNCPDAAGTAANNGCPDTDNDGVIDLNDKCPKLAGAPGNDGCPEVAQEVKKSLDTIFTNLIFASNSSYIDRTSFDDLDELARIMSNDKNLRLSIEGHTDNKGKAEYNLSLSSKRAASVKEYLVTRGISPLRIKAAGYGETKPIASNETAAGRIKNRRVELNISYN